MFSKVSPQETPISQRFVAYCGLLLMISLFTHSLFKFIYRNALTDNESTDICDILHREKLPTSEKFDCDPRYHKGPYVIIKRPSLGYFNQYLKLISALYLVRNFPGTIIFPSSATTRHAYEDFYDTNWLSVNSSYFFDVEYLMKYWQSKQISMCLESSKLNLTSKHLIKFSFCEQFVKRSLKVIDTYEDINKPECYDAASLKITPKNFSTFVTSMIQSGNRTLTSSHAVILEPYWEILPPVKSYHSKNDPNFRDVREAALSLRFSKKILCLARKIFQEFSRSARLNNITEGFTIGIHARLEKDWEHRTAKVPKSKKVLEIFQHKIEQLKTKPSAVYIAVGDLECKSAKKLNEWANRNFGDHWFTKSNFTASEDLKSLPLEAHAAVEAAVLLQMDLFFGQALSSFDAVICEIRTFINKPSELLFEFLGAFRPFLTQRKCQIF